jgi:hypothetical protein
MTSRWALALGLLLTAALPAGAAHATVESPTVVVADGDLDDADAFFDGTDYSLTLGDDEQDAVITTNVDASLLRAAAQSGTTLRLQSSTCAGQAPDSASNAGHANFAWYGSASDTASKQASSKYRVSGKMYTCFAKYRIVDEDSNYDYYAAAIDTKWEYTKGRTHYRAKAVLQVASSVTATVARGTDTYVSASACSRQVDVGLTLGVFSVATPMQICEDYSVKLENARTTGARWTMANVGKADNFEVMYIQKVTAGKKPTFTMTTSVPNDKLAWSESKNCWCWNAGLRSITRKL